MDYLIHHMLPEFPSLPRLIRLSLSSILPATGCAASTMSRSCETKHKKKNFHCDGTLANTNVLQKKTRLTMTNLQLVVYLEVNWGSHLNTASRAVP